MVEVEVELLVETLLGEEEHLGAGEEEEAAWTEMLEVAAGVSTLLFDSDHWQYGGQHQY